jgi:hypothetical protein
VYYFGKNTVSHLNVTLNTISPVNKFAFTDWCTEEYMHIPQDLNLQQYIFKVLETCKIGTEGLSAY